MKKVFGQSVFCRLNITVGEDSGFEKKTIALLEQTYFRLFGESIDYSHVRIDRMPLYYYFDEKVLESTSKNRINIQQVLKRFGDWNCFGRNGDTFGFDSPLPRMLIRANGNVYSCIGFTNVFLLGNILKQPLSEIVAYANTLEPIQIIVKKGIRGLYDYIKKKSPIVQFKTFPKSDAGCSICSVCRYLKGELQKTYKKTL